MATALACGLARRGHAVTVCTTDARDRGTRLSAAWSHGDLDVRVFRNRSNRLAYHWQLFLPRGLRAFVNGAVSTFDIVHIHGHRHLLEAVSAAACRRHHVPYVLTPNGTAPRHERRLMAKRVWDGLWGRRDLGAAAAVLAVSPAERRQLLQLGVMDKRLRDLPNPVDLDEFEPPVGSAGNRRPAASGGPLIVFLGKITPRKRLDVVVEAMRHVRTPGARLVIAGSDMGGLEAALRDAEALGLAARVSAAGAIDGRARLDLLAAADVVVYPAAQEVFGLVPLEALLCGTPVVVADDSGCAEIAGALDGAQVVPLGDARSLAAAIDRVMSDVPAWRAAAARGAAAIRRQYASDVVAADLDALYHSVLAH